MLEKFNTKSKTRGLVLIIKNSFKNIFKKKSQIFGLTLLVMLLSLLLSLLTSINARVLNGYYSLIKTSNLHDVVLKMEPSELVPIKQEIEDEKKLTPDNLVEAQQYWLTKLQEKYFGSDLQFDWSRTEGREFSQVTTKDFVEPVTIKVLAKTTSINKFNKNAVDELTIFEGHNITNDYEVVIDSIFAKIHNLHINDIIRIQRDSLGNQLLVKTSEDKNNLHEDIEQIKSEGLLKSEGIYQKKYVNNFKWFQIVGFGGSIDFSMPVVNISSPVPNRNKELLVYTNPNVFGLKPAISDKGKEYNLYKLDVSDGRLTVSSSSETESFYSLKMKNNKIPNPQQIKKMNADFNELLGQNKRPKIYFYALRDYNYTFANRTNTLESVINLYNITTSLLVVVFIIIVFYAIGLVLRDQVRKSRGQIGILKALGYNNFQVVLNFTALPFFTSFIGGILGFIFTGIFSNLIVGNFMTYFILDYKKATFDWASFVLTIMFLWIVISIFAFFIAYFVLRKNTYDLIIGKRLKPLSKWSMKLKSLFDKKHINKKANVALFLDARGKMSVLGFVVLIATMVFTVSFSAPDILIRNNIASFEGLKYKQVVEYEQPTYNNPLTFLKTFNVDNIDETKEVFSYAKELEGFTSLPINENGGYDVKTIMENYYNNQIHTEFYSVFLGQKNGKDKEPVPETTISNMRFVTPQNISATTNFYRFLSKYGQEGDILSDILLSEWPMYVEFINQLKNPLRNIDASNMSPKEKTDNALIQTFTDFQKFYSYLSSSIGLMITNLFWNKESKVNDSDDQKIDAFNKIEGIENHQKIWDYAYKKFTEQEIFEDNSNPYLKNIELLDDNKTYNETNKLQFLNSEWSIGKFKIKPNGVGVFPTIPSPDKYLDDYYVGINSADLYKNNPKEFMNALKKMIVWYGALVSQRGDVGIIQAAYGRSPYFVKQSLKESFDRQDKNYSMTFGVISYDAEQEQLGTMLNIRSKNNFNFKIYGINEKKSYSFLDLKDVKNVDLIHKLFNSSNIDNGIIINQSLAKTLNLKEGDEIDLSVIQPELHDNTKGANNRIVKLNQDWEFGGGSLREWAKNNESKNGFTQINKLAANVSFKTPSGDLDVASIANAWGPSSYYKEILNNKIYNLDKVKNNKFHIVGIHKGYGTQQAWIKENDAQKLLEYNKVKEFFWKTFFASQWGNTFSKEFKDHLPSDSDFVKKIDFSKKEFVEYEDFLKNYLNHSDIKIRDMAQKINTIFENAYPIFNYKYSNKNDVGDLQKLVSVYQKYGDFSPIALNGTVGAEESYDGMGSASMKNIIPIEISKAMLSQLSNLIFIILILMIAIVLIIVFVIILLTTSLIIGDNINFIATLKILGYTNRYISKTVLGMYFVIIAISWFIGFIAGWFIFVAIVNSFAPAIILPLKFPIWLIFAVIFAIIGIYTITFGVGFNSIGKSNALNALSVNK